MEVVTESSKKSVSEELIERIDVKDSPFQLIKVDDEIFIGMGQYRLTEVYDVKDKSVEELLKETEVISWNKLIQVMMILIESNKNVK